MPRTFATPAAFKTSLEARLKTIAAQRKTDINSLRLKLVMERLLARLFYATNPPWILKGGYDTTRHQRTSGLQNSDSDAGSARSTSYHLADPETVGEELIRTDVYAMFQGSRYLRIDGSINLRKGSRILTDIDAVILDKTSGCLALFQLKWQDFFTNDVRSLRSRASNLTRELDAWAETVTAWLKTKTSDEIAKALRLSPSRDGRIRTVYLFGLSRGAERMQGYGYSTKHPRLAIANWPQFVRVRREVGPVDLVLPAMHSILLSEAAAIAGVKPLPMEYTIAETVLRFEDLWNSLPENESDPNHESA